MTIIQLEYIIAVDTHKSFAEAAQSCYVSQPALSMQIKKIEEELGILIFDRSKKPVLTTDIGKAIINQSREIIRQVQGIQEIVDNQKGEVGGELRVGIIPTLSPYLLPLFITKFMKKYPSVKLVIEELLTNQIVTKLNNDLLDVGILVSPLNENSILEIPLFYEPFMVYASKTHPFSKRTKNALCHLVRNLEITNIYQRQIMILLIVAWLVLALVNIVASLPLSIVEMIVTDQNCFS